MLCCAPLSSEFTAFVVMSIILLAEFKLPSSQYITDVIFVSLKALRSGQPAIVQMHLLLSEIFALHLLHVVLSAEVGQPALE